MAANGCNSEGQIHVHDVPPIGTKVLWTFTTINIHQQDLNVAFADVIKSLEMNVIYLVTRRSGVECKLLVS
ncbi:hypothetical protein DEO72_LG7g1551 [Vigna unguiculata]|uniref:Uncharacterized protein n=1 Tax=Vigna unguiculata TaxID=3917 RepID=A0A4D6MFR0_VIGUN|nr:hypothetical protein DEO72_LG7g1551 [Vigna unguiculata]